MAYRQKNPTFDFWHQASYLKGTTFVPSQVLACIKKPQTKFNVSVYIQMSTAVYIQIITAVYQSIRVREPFLSLLHVFYINTLADVIISNTM